MKTLLLSACLCVAAAVAPAQETELGSITGKVADAASGAPIADALVRLVPAGVKFFYTAHTGEDGTFSALRLNPGLYRVSAEQSGFAPAESRVPLTLQAGEQIAGVELKLRRQGVITGRVFDAAGDPVSAVWLRLLRQTYVDGKREFGSVPLPQLTSIGGTVVSDDRGVYRVYLLSPGIYALQVNGSSQRSQAFEITPGRVISNADIHLVPQPTQHVTLKIENRTGKSGAVTLHVSGLDGQNGGNGRSGPDGSYAIDLTPGRYQVQAMLPDGDSFVTMGVATFEAATGAEQTVIVRLKPLSKVSGKIALDGGGAVPGQIQVQIRGNGLGLLSYNAKYQSDGTFELPDVARTSYALSVNGIPPDAYLESIRIGEADHEVDLMKENLTVESEEVGPIRIKLASGAPKLSGNTEPGVKVVLVPDTPNRGRRDLYPTAAADQNGHFSFFSSAGLTPGEYKLFAWEEVEDTAWLNPEFLARFEDRGVPLKLERGTDIRIDVPAIH